jgi:hypothetical protein
LNVKVLDVDVCFDSVPIYHTIVAAGLLTLVSHVSVLLTPLTTCSCPDTVLDPSLSVALDTLTDVIINEQLIF